MQNYDILTYVWWWGGGGGVNVSILLGYKYVIVIWNLCIQGEYNL